MIHLILLSLDSLLIGFWSRAAMQAEIIALRHQLTVLQRSQKPRPLVLNRCDRCLWVWLSRLWSGWRSSEASVKKYMVRNPKPPSQTWRTFLNNHVSQLASVDFFTVHTVWFEILFVFIVLAHDRRRIVHFNVTAHPTAEWTAQQILEDLLRDRDRIYRQEFHDQVAVMNINEVLGARRSPWQRPYVERVIGSIRRECLDHMIVFDEDSLRRTLPHISRITIAHVCISL
jgi:hypothetical protein